MTESCCASTKCSKINYWGGTVYEVSYPAVYVSATTGTISSAVSGDKATVVIKGTKGSTTGYLKANGRSGGTVISKIPAPGAIGKIVSVKLVANSQDGWEFTNIKVKVGNGKYVEMGPTDQWLDGKPYDPAYSYGYLAFSDKITLLPNKCNKPIPHTHGVKDIKAISCGDCDLKYKAIQNRKLIGLKACAAICKREGCEMFSYGEKNIDGGAGLGCRIATGKTCPNSVNRYCKETGKSWVKGVIKQQGKAM